VSVEKSIAATACETAPAATDSVENPLSNVTKITLPYSIKGTSLIVEEVAAYDGPYLEDGSDHEVSNVMALLLRNVGKDGVAKAEITLHSNSQKLKFVADTIPPDTTILVLEKNRSLYGEKNFTKCEGWQVTECSDWTNWEVAISEIDMGVLKLTNQSENLLSNINIYYKNHVEGIYVGGITFIHRIESVAPGETVYIHPNHYARGYSKVIRITAKKQIHRQMQTVGG